MVLYASTTDRHRPSVHLYSACGGGAAAAVVVVVMVNDVLLRCVPMVIAKVSTIDGYGFSLNYVGRGNTTDNTYQSLYDFFINYNVV